MNYFPQNYSYFLPFKIIIIIYREDASPKASFLLTKENAQIPDDSYVCTGSHEI